MSISLVVDLAHILTLILFAVLGGQILRLWRLDNRQVGVSMPETPPVIADLSGRPDSVLADYIGELMAGTQDAQLQMNRPKRVNSPEVVAAPPKPTAREPDAPVTHADFPSVAALLARRCDTSSA